MNKKNSKDYKFNEYNLKEKKYINVMHKIIVRL